MFVKDPFHSIQAAREQRFEPQLFPLKSAHSESAGNLRNEVEGQFLRKRERHRWSGKKKEERKKERKKKERKKENAVFNTKVYLGRRQAEGSYITLKGVYFTVITNGLYITLVITWLRDHKMKQDRQHLTVTYTV